MAQLPPQILYKGKSASSPFCSPVHNVSNLGIQASLVSNTLLADTWHTALLYNMFLTIGSRENKENILISTRITELQRLINYKKITL